jgi:hypothetical protein
VLRIQLSKKESDLARLRGQRDDLMSELSEKKAGEAERGRSSQELKALAASREVRSTLSSPFSFSLEKKTSPRLTGCGVGWVSRNEYPR